MWKNNREQHIVLSAEEMRAVDNNTINNFGISGLQLMENAGAAAARILQKIYPLQATDIVAVVCGAGNNGGDGFFVARNLRQAGKKLRVYFVGEASKQSADAREAQHLLEAADVPVEKRAPDASELSAATILVDALFGTGFRGPVRGPEFAVINALNAAGRPIVCLDIPSGINANSFVIPECCIVASVTIAFGFPKHSQLVEPTKSLMGNLEIVDIGFPPDAIQCVTQPATLLTERTLPLDLLERKTHSHKGTYGHVLVIGGSRGMYGAPVLTAQAALHAGAGLVSIVLVGAETEILPAIPPEIMTLRIVDSRGHFSPEHLVAIAKLIEQRQFSAIVVGMGQGSEADTVEFTRGVLAMAKCPVVIDADGLRALDSQLRATKNIIATPHAGEYQRWSGDAELLEGCEGPILRLKNSARKAGVVIVHKSSTTLIAEPGGCVFFNTSGNPGMATAGMGDTLAGIIGAFCAQGLATLESAKLGVYLHGLAGDLCAKEVGELSVTASAVAMQIGRAWQFSKLRKAPSEEKFPRAPWSLS